jgi:hypothetical protein
MSRRTAFLISIIFFFLSHSYAEASYDQQVSAVAKKNGVNVYVRSYNVCRKHYLHMTFTCEVQLCYVVFAAAIQHFCDNTHDGGSWLLVRRVKQGSSWHPANDNLAGTAPAYGTYGSATFDGTFGIPYSFWLQSSTEFLFMTGRASVAFVMYVH